MKLNRIKIEPKPKEPLKKLNSKIVKKINIKQSKEEADTSLSELDKECQWREKEITRIFKEERNRGGRPTKFSPEVMRDAAILARLGCSYVNIADSLMIDYSTLMDWINKNEEFSLTIKRAREKGKDVLVNSILGHGRKQWQATAWILERMHRKDFALDKTKVELTGKDGTPLNTSPAVILFDFGSGPQKEANGTTVS